MQTQKSIQDARDFVKSLQAGDDLAIRTFVRNYGPRIYGFLKCIVHSHEIAEDLCQEVLIKACRKCGQLKSADKFESWLFTLTRNSAYREMSRKRYKLETHLSTELFDNMVGSRGEESLKKISNQESAVILNQALASLSDKRREIMALRYYSGLSLKEIAEITKTPTGSIGTTIKRSLETLKKYFNSRGVRVEDIL
jgi:RNA polymerase sigma-70 factor, ECF subfamily